jgi:hypothetical protein
VDAFPVRRLLDAADDRRADPPSLTLELTDVGLRVSDTPAGCGSAHGHVLPDRRIPTTPGVRLFGVWLIPNSDNGGGLATCEATTL